MLGFNLAMVGTDDPRGCSQTTRLARWFLGLSVAIILVATLIPLEPRRAGLEVRCVFCGIPSLAHAVLNVGLFLPFGFACWLNRYSIRRIAVFGGLLSAGVEIAQMWVPGRYFDLSDVVFNTLGAMVGGAHPRSASAWLTPSPRLAERLAVSSALLGTAAVAATGILLGPSLPSTRYFGSWTHQGGYLESYGGRLHDASIGGVEIPAGPISHSAEVRRRLLAGAPLRVSMLAGPPPAGLAPLLGLLDENHIEILLLGADRDDLVFRFRTRAAVASLDSPALRLPGALRGFARGEPLEITVSRDHNARCIDVNGAPTCGLGFTAGIGWAFLLFRQNVPWPLHPLLNVAWLAALWFPSGFWARGRRELLVAAALLLASLLLLPGLTGLLDTPAPEIGAAVAGFVVGRGLGSLNAKAARIVPWNTTSRAQHK